MVNILNTWGPPLLFGAGVLVLLFSIVLLGLFVAVAGRGLTAIVSAQNNYQEVNGRAAVAALEAAEPEVEHQRILSPERNIDVDEMIPALEDAVRGKRRVRRPVGLDPREGDVTTMDGNAGFDDDKDPKGGTRLYAAT